MQATRAFRLASDKLPIGAGGSFGASSNKGVGEINSFSEAGPAALPLSIVMSPPFSVCLAMIAKQATRACLDQAADCVHASSSSRDFVKRLSTRVAGLWLWLGGHSSS